MYLTRGKPNSPASVSSVKNLCQLAAFPPRVRSGVRNEAADSYEQPDTPSRSAERQYEIKQRLVPELC